MLPLLIGRKFKLIPSSTIKYQEYQDLRFATHLIDSDENFTIILIFF